MCAADDFTMEPHVVSRFNSTSTSRTLFNEDDGLQSPTATPLSIIDEKLQAAGPIIQTKDNKQWIDLDSISPKLLKELRRQYDTSEDEKKPLAKGAAKIKAWTRQTKLGFDIRLRRKINAEHDEITDFCLVRDPMPLRDAGPTAVPEMPENAVFELPDTSIVPELSAFQTGQDIDSQDEPLPRYEPPPGRASVERPRLHLDTSAVVDEQVLEQRSPSESSIVATPTKGLSVPEDGDEVDPVSCSTCEDGSQLKEELNGTKQLLEHELNAKEELQTLLKALREQLSSQSLRDAPQGVERLKLVETNKYDVDTDAEIEMSPRLRTPRKRAGGSLHIRKKRALKPRSSPKRSPVHVETDDEPETSLHQLPRRLTLPKRVDVSDGAEAAWTAVLKAQSKILGAEHPLIWSTKHAMALSRVQHHQNCSSDLLDSLYESERTAIQTLGKVHPLVEAFSADLKTLEVLVLDKAAGEASQRHSRTPPSHSDPAWVQGADRRCRQSPAVDDNAQEQPSPAIAKELTLDRSSLPIIQTSFHDETPVHEEAKPQMGMGREGLWNTWTSPHKQQSDLVVFSRLAFTAVTGSLKNGLAWLERTYGPEPPVEPGKVRVRWTCSCGGQLYDDFVERRPGAARELEAYLNRPRTKAGGTPTSPSSSRSYNSSFNNSLNSSVGGTLSTNTSWSSYSQTSNGFSEKARPQTASSQYSPFVSIAEPPWLLVCTNEDRLTPKVTHLDVAQHKITSDKDLAKTLREHYFEVNRKWWRKLRLRGLTTIEFVQFECHQNRFADIRKCPDMPPAGRGDYTFEPSELIPPVGNAYLKHLFNHPEDYDGELITYLRAPKKIARLQLGVGWGINMVEGFLADRVWLCVNVLFVFVSLVFGVAWACKKNDIQGAFGVAQWICTLAVFAGGWAQACLG